MGVCVFVQNNIIEIMGGSRRFYKKTLQELGGGNILSYQLFAAEFLMEGGFMCGRSNFYFKKKTTMIYSQVCLKVGFRTLVCSCPCVVVIVVVGEFSPSCVKDKFKVHATFC